MKGFIKQTAVTFGFGTALFTLLGCYHYREIVDPCWPERYNAMARHSVREMFNAQADKGHILDHTVWGNDFEGRVLKPSGIERLRYMAHREPVPMLMKVYLQNAIIPYDAKKSAQEQINAREALNRDRIQAIEAFLATQRSEVRPTAYEILIHDYVQPTYPAEDAINAIDNSSRNIKGAKLQTFEIPGESTGGSSK